MVVSPSSERGWGSLEAEYEIRGELGRGGASVVYLGWERELEREVAIKVMRDQFIEDPEALARAEREARMLAHLQHPNIVTLLAARRLADDTLALVMQLAHGQTLRQALDDGLQLSYEQVENVLRNLASGLAYVHARGIIHRDVKPENIFLEEDGSRALLSDFSIAKSPDPTANVTLAGVVLGTPTYMSPEQIDGIGLDGRSDLYSLGLVMYELVTRERPWSGASIVNVIYKQKHEKLPPLHEKRPEVPTRLRLAIERCLAKYREERWASAAELLEFLEREMLPLEVVLPDTDTMRQVPMFLRERERRRYVPAAPPPAAPAEPTPQRDERREAKPLPPAAGEAPMERGKLLAAGLFTFVFAATVGVFGTLELGPSLGGELNKSALIALPPMPAQAALPKRTAAPARTVSESRSPASAEQARSEGTASRELAVRPLEPRITDAPRAQVSGSREARAAVEVTPRLQPLDPAGERLAGVPVTEAFTAAQLQNRTAVIRSLEALYPADVRRGQPLGTVVLSLVIDEHGLVVLSRVARSSGQEALDAAAVEVSRQMRFNPARSDGMPVPSRVRLPLVLEGSR